MILHYLIPHSDSVHAVAKTCTRLYHVALHLTVHTFRNLGVVHNLVPDREQSLNRAGSKTMRFIRYITITKPHLARHVKCLKIGRMQPMGQLILDNSEAPRGHELRIYQDLIDQTMTPDESDHWESWRSEWRAALAGLAEDAQVALLLVACPNIEQLFMAEANMPDLVQGVLGVAGRRSLRNTQGPLQQLRELSLETNDTEFGFITWHTYETALLIQSLRSFEVILARGDRSNVYFAKVPGRSSNLEEIILRKSILTPLSLNALCAVPKGLRRFEYTNAAAFSRGVDIKPRHVINAMIPHAATLEYLHMDAEDDHDPWGSMKDLCMGVELKKLTALKHLAVGMRGLTGHRNPLAFSDGRIIPPAA